MKIVLTKKQTRANKLLKQPEIREVLFGGSAGGGKSFYGCVWIIHNCIKYQGSRWLIGRSKLKNLKQTTLRTFFEVAAAMGMENEVHFTYNSQSSEITFSNGSEVILKDLFLYPSDPNFDSLGSLELTGAFIDEVNQISKKAKDIVKSRIRFKLEEFGLTPKLFMSCNPARNWVYEEFYKPWKEGKLLKYRAFIPALATDNPNISPLYLENLAQLDEVDRQRLLEGNWEYSEEGMLMDFDQVINMFKSEPYEETRDARYMTIDVAREGKDKTVIFIWEGLNIIHHVVEDKSNILHLSKTINQLEREWRVSYTIADEDGVGGGVVDVAGVDGFRGGSSAVMKENYMNLRTQCYHYLSKNLKHIGIYSYTQEIKDALSQELAQIKRVDIGKDGKYRINSKDDIKERIGRSPDYADAIMMRMYYELYNSGFTGYV